MERGGGMKVSAVAYHGDRSQSEKRCNEACTCFQNGKSKASQTNDWFPAFFYRAGRDVK